LVNRQPPHNVDTEEALIGALMLDGQVMRNIVNLLKLDDFYSERNKDIYQACLNLYQRREPIQQISAGEELSRIKRLDKIGGSAYLNHCLSVCPTSMDAEFYAKTINLLSLSRRLISVGEKLSEVGYKMSPTENELITESSGIFEEFKKSVNSTNTRITTPIQAGNDIINLIEKYGEPGNAIKWGYHALDDITAGIYPEYILFGSRPSVGKSQLMLDVADNVSGQGKTILFISAEMSNNQIYERGLSREVGISILDIRKFGISPEKQTKIVEYAGKVSEGKVNILAGKVSISDIERELDKTKPDILFVDYVGALTDAYAENKDSQATRISRISNKLQSLNHDFKIPFIVASQLNREVEHRTDNVGKGQNKSHKPQLSDLRDSGSLEQDADVVLLLHREEEANGDLSPILKIKMAKNRQLGPSKAVDLLFNYNLHKYVDYSNRSE
jgi:replicative DNA helicase